MAGRVIIFIYVFKPIGYYVSGVCLCVILNHSTGKNHVICVIPSVKFDALLHKTHTNVASTKAPRLDKFRSTILFSKITIESGMITYSAKKNKVTKRARMGGGQNFKKGR